MRRRILLSDGSMPPDQYEYVDLGLPSGLKWCKTDVGAFNEGDYGLYFSWGGTKGYTSDEVGSGTGKHHFDWSDYEFGNASSSASALTKYNSTDGKTVLDPEDDAATVNMGEGWRMPTQEEYQELVDNTNYEWVTNYKGSGHNVMKLTSKTDSSKYITFPASGTCLSGSVYDVGSYGCFWSSYLDTSDARYGRRLDVSSSGRYTYRNYRYVGLAVRGVYTEPITPETLSYRINQTIPTAAPGNMIIKSTPSKDMSPDTDVIAWIHENTDIVVANTSLSSGKLRCAKTSRTDKTKYPDGTSIPNFTSKDVFVKLPEFWWKVEQDTTDADTDIHKIGFSKTAKYGWNHWEGNTFIGVYKAYNSSSKVYSRSGVTPTVKLSQANFKTYARARGTGYTLITYEAHCMLALLGYGWLGTTDSQSVVGYGSTDYPKQTGKCNSLGITDTTTSNGGSSSSNSTSTSINFWGIENWWGDIYEWVDNLNTANTTGLINILDSSGNVVRTVQSPITSNGCIGKMMLGEHGDMIPKETHSNTSYNNGFCDYGAVSASSGYVAARSRYGADASGGLGCLILSNSSSVSGATLCSRLQYKGDYTMVNKL